MSAVIRSEFQHRRAAQIAAQDVAHAAQTEGFRQGYAVGYRKALRYALYAWIVVGWIVFVPLAVYLTFGG